VIADLLLLLEPLPELARATELPGAVHAGWIRSPLRLLASQSGERRAQAADDSETSVSTCHGFGAFTPRASVPFSADA
jgi:hypothetical protein